jgi:Xaa-Pro aminopeptidase
MFPRSEMERRYARAQALMAERGIDALLISGEENFKYFAGTSSTIASHYSLTRPQLFILPVKGDPIIYTQYVDTIELSTYVQQIRGYTSVLQFPHDLIVAGLKEVVGDRGRIGAELGQEQRMGMPVGAYLDLARALPDGEFVDAADIIIRLRMVKSPIEVDFMRKAAAITGRARQRLYEEAITPGITERETVRALKRLMLEEGADGTSFVHIQGNRPGQENQYPYDRPLERGMVIGMDCGAWYRMYTVDYPRFAVLGKATDEQRRVHEAAKYVSRQMADAIRPGLRCSELYWVGANAVNDVDVELDRHHKRPEFRMGHGQGMGVTEPPSIVSGDETVLETGMTLSTEPGVSGGAARGNVEYLWEDTHVVTDDGHEQLTLETDELREIPF